MSFPDPLVEAIDILEAAAPSVLVASNVPASRPTKFVRVWVNGGAAEQAIYERPTLSVTVWAGTDKEAADLAADCRQAFLSRWGARSELTRPYFDPDPTTGEPRYSFSFRARNRA